jgi:hypothetical protein
MHSLLWNMPHSWYAHMIIHSNVTSHLGGSWSQKTYAKILHQCKVSSLRKFVQNVLIGFGQSICFPKNVSSAFILTNTEKQIKVVFAQRHNFRWASSQLSSYTKTANRAFPRLKTCFAADTSERCERSLPLIKHLENSPTIWRAPYMYKYPY